LITGIGGSGKTSLSSKFIKGGVGKTKLSVKLAEKLREKLSFVVWKSLINTPDCNDILKSICEFIENGDKTKGETILDRIINSLSKKRGLILLDNLESVLSSSDEFVTFKDKHRLYSRFITEFAKISHNSCLILTSREIPIEINSLSQTNRYVKILRLDGLTKDDAELLIENISDIDGRKESIECLIKLYDGNPLAIQLAAMHIKDVYQGSIEAFIKYGESIFKNIEDLLNWHLNRLTDTELEVIRWLAVNREPKNIQELKDDLLLIKSKNRIGSTINSLMLRIPIVKTDDKISLQPVLLEHVTNNIIKKACEELNGRSPPSLLKHISLLKAQSYNYIKESQERVVIQPIIEQSEEDFGSKELFLKRLKELFNIKSQDILNSYFSGNLLNLYLKESSLIDEVDLSNRHIYQVDFTRNFVRNINFKNVKFNKCAFKNTFGKVLSVDIDSSAKYIAIGDSLGVVRLVTTEGALLFSELGHSDWVRSVKFHEGDKYLISAGDDGRVIIWQNPVGGCIRVIDIGDIWIRDFALLNDDMYCAGDDGIIRVFKLSTGKKVRELIGHKEKVYTLKISPDKKTLVSGSEDSSVRIWDIESNKCVKIIDLMIGAVSTVLYSNDEGIILCGGNEAKLLSVDTSTGLIGSTFNHHQDWIRCIVNGGDKNIFVSSGDDSKICIFNADKEDSILSTLEGHDDRVQSISYANNTLVSGSDDSSVILWELINYNCLRVFKGHSNGIRCCHLIQNSEKLIFGGEDGNIYIWNSQTCISDSYSTTHNGMILSLAVDIEESILATASDDKTIRIWDLASMRCKKVLYGHTSWIYSIQFADKRRKLVSSGQDGTIRIWCTINWTCESIIETGGGWVRRISISPDNSMVASVSKDSTVKLWSLQDRTMIKVLNGHSKDIWGICFSDDGKLLVSTSDDATIKVWNTAFSQPLKTIKGHTGRIRTLDFHPNSEIIASGSDDKTIKIWNINTGKLLATLSGHTSRVREVKFSSCGAFIVSASEDSTCRLWNFRNQSLINIIQCPRPYENVLVTGATGINQAEINSLVKLGAIY